MQETAKIIKKIDKQDLSNLLMKLNQLKRIHEFLLQSTDQYTHTRRPACSDSVKFIFKNNDGTISLEMKPETG